MAREINSVQISGNLGRNPEFKQTGNGLATFSLAVNRFIPRGNGQFDKQTSWFKCVAWGPVAEAARDKLAKGCRVMVQGRLEAHNWTGPNGEVKTGVEIVVQSFSLMAEGKNRQVEEEAGDPPIEKPAAKAAETPAEKPERNGKARSGATGKASSRKYGKQA